MPAALFAAAAFLACAAALLAAPEEAEATFPGKNGRVAFSAEGHLEEPTQEQIFTIDADGTDEKQLTNTARAYNDTPSFSADGRKITWERSGDIWVMDADGTHKQRVTFPTDRAYDSDPAFAPGGRRVAFVRYDPEEGQRDIYTKKLRGGDLRRVTDDKDYEGGLRFRPGGGMIAFERSEAVPGCGGCFYPSEIATVRTDGTGLEVITDTPDVNGERAGATDPDWSPDGRMLVFGSYQIVPERQRLETVRADGTRRRTLFAPDGVFPGSPVFSPDGAKVAFGIAGSPHVFWTIDADGTGPPTPVTDASDPERRESGPSWGPKPTTAR